jgi:hypothetical protein
MKPSVVLDYARVILRASCIFCDLTGRHHWAIFLREIDKFVGASHESGAADYIVALAYQTYRHLMTRNDRNGAA